MKWFITTADEQNEIKKNVSFKPQRMIGQLIAIKLNTNNL